MITTKDSLNAYMLRQLPKDSVVITHSAGNEDIYKANYLNALMKLKTDYKLISIGSPKSKKDLRESTNAVGAELVRQVNHPYDPVSGVFNSGERERYTETFTEKERIRSIGVNALTEGIKGYIMGGIPKAIIGSTTGAMQATFNIMHDDLENYHPFESYYENPKFQIQQMIEKIFIENSIKEMNRGGITNDKN